MACFVVVPDLAIADLTLSHVVRSGDGRFSVACDKTIHNPKV